MSLILLAISDIHERIRSINKLVSEINSRGITIDIVIIAGDLTYFKGVSTAIKILKEIKEKLSVEYVFFVPGNCDDPKILGLKEISRGIINIHRNPVELEDYTFYGIGGGGLSPFNTLIEFSEKDFSEYVNYIENVSVNTTNLVMTTHQPIRGFFDNVDGLNIGSQVFREFLEKRKPLLWITGHVHENSGWSISGRTVIVHPGPLMHGYYAFIKLSSGCVLDVSIHKLNY